jgi:hypothetical protein
MHGLSFRRAGRRGGALLLPGSAAALLAALATAAPAAGQFAVHPIVVTMSPAAGTEAVSSVFVRNEGDATREFRFEIEDFDQDSVGTPRFLPLGAHPQSCAGRISVFPEAATLAAGETQELRITLAGTEGVCWAALFAEARSGSANGIAARQQIGVRVNAVPPGTSIDGEIARVEVITTPEPSVNLWFRNTGAAPIRPAGRLELRDAAGTVVAVIDVDAFSVLPGVVRRLPVHLAQRLPAGRYTAVAVLDFGGDYLAGGQAAFVVR